MLGVQNDYSQQLGDNYGLGFERACDDFSSCVNVPNSILDFDAESHRKFRYTTILTQSGG